MTKRQYAFFKRKNFKKAKKRRLFVKMRVFASRYSSIGNETRTWKVFTKLNNEQLADAIEAWRNVYAHLFETKDAIIVHDEIITSN